MKVKIPQYELPETRRLLERDAAIGQWLLRWPDAPSREQIIREYQMSPLKFYERAKYLRPIVRALGKQAIIDLLLEAGRETAIKKGISLE